MIETEAEMRGLIAEQEPIERFEYQVVPQGLSLTTTIAAKYWYYREDRAIAILRVPFEGETSFEIQSW